MAAKTLKQVLETHDQIVQGFVKYKKTLGRTRPTGSELVVKQKRVMLAALDERLENAKTARDDALKRHDAGIERIELSRKKLSDEIATDEEKLGGGKGTGRDGRGGRGGGPQRSAVTPRAVATPIERVKGIGKEFGSRLEQKNIRSAHELAAMDPEEVADILSISESRAAALVSAAKKLK